MRQRDLEKRIKFLMARINKDTGELLTLRAVCKHPPGVVTKTHQSDTGNYDPSQDRFWTDFRCSACGKFWREEGSK